MALATSLKVNLGVAMVRTVTTGSATVLIVFLPSNSSDLSRVLNSSRGRSRKSAAMRTSGARLASTCGSLPSDRASNPSSKRFSCSILASSSFVGSFFPGFRERLGIGTLQARPQTGQGTKLQLFHRTLGLTDLPRHFLDTFLLHKPQHHHSLLLRRQPLHQAKQRRPPFHLFECRAPRRYRLDLVRFVGYLLPVRSLPTVRNQVGRDAE